MAKRQSRTGSPKGPPEWPKRRPPDNLILPQEVRTFVAHPGDSGTRLDRFLKMKLKWRSRTKVQELIRNKEITIAGARVDSAYRLKLGDEVRIPLPPPPEDAFRIAEIPLDILYEDDLLVVLNKQPNIIVQPVGPHRYNTIINALHLKYRNLEDDKKDIHPKLAHRIDRETSGVLVAYKSGRYDRSAPIAFENMDMTKEYLALAEGRIEEGSGTIDLPVGAEPGTHRYSSKRVVTAHGAHALTEYQVVERFDAFTLLRLRIHTGRQHQIRVHLQSQGHPVVCDKRYGLREELRLSDIRPLGTGEEDSCLLDRQALHSCLITFPHPTTNKPLTVEAPLPEDMLRTLSALREKSGARPA